MRDDGSAIDEVANIWTRWRTVARSSESETVGVEMFRKLLDEGMAGDNVGLLLRGIQKEDIERGMVLVKKGSITPHTKFEGEVYVLKKERKR